MIYKKIHHIKPETPKYLIRFLHENEFFIIEEPSYFCNITGINTGQILIPFTEDIKLYILSIMIPYDLQNS